MFGIQSVIIHKTNFPPYGRPITHDTDGAPSMNHRLSPQNRLICVTAAIATVQIRETIAIRSALHPLVKMPPPPHMTCTYVRQRRIQGGRVAIESLPMKKSLL